MLDCGYVCSMVAMFSGDIVEPSALTALSLFDHIGPHYTYILVNTYEKRPMVQSWINYEKTGQEINFYGRQFAETLN